MTESWVILGTTCLNWYLCRFPTYTPGQQRGPSPPQNLGQRPPNAGEDLVEKPVYDMNPLHFPGGGPQQYQMHPMHQQQPQQQQTCYTFHVPQVCYLCTLTSNIRTITKSMDISPAQYYQSKKLSFAGRWYWDAIPSGGRWPPCCGVSTTTTTTSASCSCPKQCYAGGSRWHISQ